MRIQKPREWVVSRGLARDTPSIFVAEVRDAHILAALSSALLSSDPFPLLRQLVRDLGGEPPEGTEESGR